MPKQLNKLFSVSLATLAAAVALVSFVPGCGEEAMDDGCFDYASFKSDSRTVSFQTDVLPVFRNSCGLSAACHGSESGPAGQSYLGPPSIDGMATQAQIDAIFTQNVGVNSTKAATMKIVDPGSPETSFLMHKMDNTLKCADVKCEAGCGGSMPLANPILGDKDRETVRLWIAQGAKKD
ncbi:MAG: hypothetical protein IPM54_18720 [Polyangiaceae bacterium]|nr:hypothetical protein [Polyangiaceae bacterium]